MEEHEAPTTNILVPDSPRRDVQREELDENIDPTNPMEPFDHIERPRDVPPSQRRLS